MKVKLKAHVFTLPRWFAAPFFGAALLFGVALAGDFNSNAWIALVGGLLIMAGGHSFNSYLDYAWTGLDKGETDDRSAEKDYCGGQSIIAQGIVSQREVLCNAIGWYVLALIPIIYLAVNSSAAILPLALAGMAITFWYSKAKFNYTHELALGIGVGPIAVPLGMFAVNPDANWLEGLVVSAPFAIILSFAGLAFDEWPDAEANLKKGVKSLAYKVWQYGISLEWYLTSWILFMFLYQVLMIAVGILNPMSAIAFLTYPFLIGTMIMLKEDFRKFGGLFVISAAMYPILLLLGQVIG